VDAYRAVRAVRAGTYGDVGVNAPYAPATGIGLIEASRGSYHVYGDPDGDGVPQQISGEIDALGNAWSAGTPSGMPWASSPWSPLVSEFEEWDVLPWTGPTWSGMVLDAAAWSAKHWSNSGWVAKHWSARHWSASVWN
jgi:serine protease AprX